MAQQKLVVRSVEDITLMEVKTYMWTTLLTFRHTFIVSHKWLPLEIGFDDLDDAETFFSVEVQRRSWDRKTNKLSDMGHKDMFALQSWH
jgi:hypothetical protein